LETSKGINHIFLTPRVGEKCGIKIEAQDGQYWPLCSRELLQSFQPDFEKIARSNFGFFQISFFCKLNLETNIVAFANIHTPMFKHLSINLGEFETHQSSKLAQRISIFQCSTLDTKSREK
jgi:hypothetical protein